MRKFLLTILLTALFLSACQKSGSSSNSGFDLLGGDDSQEAVKLIDDANVDLKKIRAIYKDNQGKAEELKTAMSNKETEKVKEIAGNLVTQIDEGIKLGESAFEKIEKARDLNINDTYKEYLEKKAQSLRQQIDAFEFRKKSAQMLRDNFGGKDPKVIEVMKLKFKEADDNFQKLMDDGRNLSKDANEIAKEAAQKK